MSDKAKEYAMSVIERTPAFGSEPGDGFFMGWLAYELILINAYRAGHAAGLVDAHRKEFIKEQPDSFARELNSADRTPGWGNSPEGA